MIIVIDGPAGSGKSSTARSVADAIGIQYLDSGALYRALTLIYLIAGKREERFFELLGRTSISFRYEDKKFKVYLDDEEATGKIRSTDVDRYVSEVAALPEARRVVNELMREAVKKGIYIAEGRDLGTAVFPEADLKFFMVADMEARVRRRYKELQSRNPEILLEQVRQGIRERDRKDSERERDPLRKAPDAIEIDTTNMTFEQQVQFICSDIKPLMETDI